MATYRRGSLGPEVEKIQTRLQELGTYHGPVDGIFGGGTESAVRAFQVSVGLVADGLVGPNTWGALFAGEETPVPGLASHPVDFRVLALTGAFETGAPFPECFAGLAGDFDDQGISFGVLQWNLGQGTLQTLLRELDQQHREVLDAVLHDRATELRAVLNESRDEQLSWARSIQDPVRHRVHEPWHGLFKALGRRPEMQEVQRNAAHGLYAEALDRCETYGLRSERGAALMFDIRVQNGSINAVTRAQIERDFARIATDTAPDDVEVERMTIIANRRAEASRPRFIEDVRARKLVIARGQGRVHGRHYDLADDYALRLKPLE